MLLYRTFFENINITIRDVFIDSRKNRSFNFIRVFNIYFYIIDRILFSFIFPVKNNTYNLSLIQDVKHLHRPVDGTSTVLKVFWIFLFINDHVWHRSIYAAMFILYRDKWRTQCIHVLLYFNLNFNFNSFDLGRCMVCVCEIQNGKDHRFEIDSS